MTSLSGRVIAWVKPSDPLIPGLIDVETSEGEQFHELTIGQFAQLATERNWDVRKDR